MKNPQHDSSVLPLAGGNRRLIRGLAVLLALVVLSAIVASACGSGTRNAVSPSTTRAATTAAGGGFDKGAVSPSTTVPGGFPTGTLETGSGSRPNDLAVKIIRNAALDLEARNAEQTYLDLLKYATDRGGYEASRQLSTGTGYAVIEARIKLAPKYLDDFLNYAGSAAKVINVSTTSQDVTESYYDVQTRLKTMEQMLDKYTEFLNRAANVNEALSVQSEINRLTTEIESLKGKLRYYDSMVAESTINLSIRETKDPVKSSEDIHWNALTFADMGSLMKRGLLSVANILTSFVQWLAIAVVAVSPLLIIALITWLIYRRRRHPRPPQDGSGEIVPTKPTGADISAVPPGENKRDRKE